MSSYRARLRGLRRLLPPAAQRGAPARDALQRGLRRREQEALRGGHVRLASRKSLLPNFNEEEDND